MLNWKIKYGMGILGKTIPSEDIKSECKKLILPLCDINAFVQDNI